MDRYVCVLALGTILSLPCARAQTLCAVTGTGGEVIYTNAPPSGRCAHPLVLAEPFRGSGLTGSVQSRLRPYEDAIVRHSRAWGVSASLVRAVIAQESGGNSNAVSRKGAVGLMQLMPATARRFSVEDPLDPEQNIAGGVQYLSELLDRYGGDVRLALAAYNAGEGAVDRHNGVPPYRETKDYVRRIMDRTGSRAGRARTRADGGDAPAATQLAAKLTPGGAPAPAALPVSKEPIVAVHGSNGVVRFEN